MNFTNFTQTTTQLAILNLRNSSTDTLFLSFNIILGIVGSTVNGLVLYIVVKLTPKSRSYFIINQFVCDLTASIFIIITYAWRMAQVQLSGIAHKIICFLIGSEACMWVCLNSSVTTLVFISVERFVMVKFPFWHRNHQREWGWICYGCIAFLWMEACLKNLPTTWISTDFSRRRCGPFLKWPRKADGNAFSIYYTCTVYIIPIIVFISSYASILFIIRKHNKIQPKIEPNIKADVKNVHDKTEMVILKTMLIITVIFVVFWFPETIYFILLNTGCCDFSIDTKEWLIVLFIGMSTSCLNPFIYGFQSGSIKMFLKKFRN